MCACPSARSCCRAAATVLVVILFSVAARPANVETSQAQQTAAGPAPIDRALFAAPPASVRPLMRWWWPGGDVEDTELSRELTEMQTAGFGGVEIQSFAVGLPPDADSRVFTYGMPAWIERVQGVLDRARVLGLTVDLTLGSAWPTGGVDVRDEDSLQQLTVSAQPITGPMRVTRTMPAVVPPLSYPVASALLKFPDTFDAFKMRLVTVLAARRDRDQTQGGGSGAPTLPDLPRLPDTVYLTPGSMVELPGTVGSNGVMTWDVPPGDWLIFAIYTGPTGSRPFYSADPGTSLVIDHFNAPVLQAYLGAFGAMVDRFGDHVGRTLRGVFVDSLELRTELYWTRDFLAEFAARRGYRLEPFLPVLFRPLAHDAYLWKIYPDAPPTFEIRGIGPRVRRDYDQTISELVIERFFTPLRAWADARQLQTRVQAHGAPADLLAAYETAAVPEAEALFAGGVPHFLRLAASAAHLAGRPVVSSEVFAFRGAPARMGDLLRMMNSQFAAGVNQLVFHGFPYEYTKGFRHKGWMPFDSPYMPGRTVIGTFGTRLNDHHPLWRFVPQLTDYAARAQLVLRSGTPVVDVALYWARLGYPDDERFAPPAADVLDRAGYTYDYVNSAALSHAKAVDAALAIGPNRYKALVVAGQRQMSLEDADRIVSLARSGVPVIFAGQVPREVFFLDPVERDRTISQVAANALVPADDPSMLYVPDVEAVPAGLANTFGIGTSVRASVPGIRHAHRTMPGGDYFFLSAPDGVAGRNVDVWLPNADRRVPDLWDLQTGQVLPAAVYVHENGGTRVQLRFEQDVAVVVGFDRSALPPHVESSPVPVTRLDDGSLVATVATPGTYEVTMNGGLTRRVTVDGPRLDSVPLQTWDIIVATESEEGVRGSQSFQKSVLTDVSAVQAYSGWSLYATYPDFSSLPDAYFDKRVRLILNLDGVHDVAEVRVNERVVGPPRPGSSHRIDITDFVKRGQNAIEVAVSATPGRAPAGLLGPVQIDAVYQVGLAFQPLQMSVVVTPPNFPDNSQQDMLGAIRRAAELTRHVHFQWFWKTPPSDARPDGGAVVECDQVSAWVGEARRLGLTVTLQFQTFYVQINGSYGLALDSFGTPTRLAVVNIASPIMPFETGTFANAGLRDAYLQQIGCLASLKPEYLVLGPEVNFVYSFDRDKWNSFRPVYADAYALAKTMSPTTQVGLSYQYDGLRTDYIILGSTWKEIASAGPQDFIGLTTYYGYSEARHREFPVPSTIPADYYRLVRDLLPDKPIVFTEIGWSAYFEDGPRTQAEFMRRLPTLLEPVRPENVAWALLHDVSYFEGAGASLNQSGLLTRGGEPKPVYEQAVAFMREGVLTNVIPKINAPPPLPFSVTAVPRNYPATFSQEEGFRAIATASEAGSHVSLQFAWKDHVTGLVWRCQDIKTYTDEVRRLGLRYTLQFNTYAALPGPTLADSPSVILLNPITPPRNDADTGPSFSDPAIRDAFLQDVGCLAEQKPDYLVLGPELNFLAATRLDEYRTFADVYRQAYHQVKAVSPDTQVGVSFQYDAMRQNLTRDVPEEYVELIAPRDFIGLTSYFAYSNGRSTYTSAVEVPADYYAPIRKRFGPAVPIMFAEIGWSSYFNNGFVNQALFVNRLPTLLGDVRPVQVIWALQHDVPGYFRGEIEPLNNQGLRFTDGTPKPAWDQLGWLRGQGLYITPKVP